MIHQVEVLENQEFFVLVILEVLVFRVVLLEFFNPFHVMNEIVVYSNIHYTL